MFNQTEYNIDPYPKVVVQKHVEATGKNVVVNNGNHISAGDIVTCSLNTQFYVADTEHVTDFFERFSILTLNFITNDHALMWNPADYLIEGTELQLVSSAFKYFK